MPIGAKIQYWPGSWNRSHYHHRLKCNSEETLQKTLKVLYLFSTIKQYHRDRKHRDVRLQTPTLSKVDCCHPRISVPATRTSSGLLNRLASYGNLVEYNVRGSSGWESRRLLCWAWPAQVSTMRYSGVWICLRSLWNMRWELPSRLFVQGPWYLFILQ